MHSLKNTVVAVGLLGLSFLFYQASSNKAPDTDGMMPALEISDGLESVKQFAGDSMEVVKSKVNSLGIEMPKIDAPNMQMPKLEMPDLNESKQMASDFIANANDSVKDKAAQLKDSFRDQISDFSDKHLAPNNSQPVVNAPISTASSSNDFAVNSFQPTQPPVNRQPMDKTARDEGLIDALNSNQMAITPPQTKPNNSFASQPVSSDSNSFGSSGNSFDSQPIPTSGSSYNKLATDVSQTSSSPNKDFGQTSLANLSFKSAWPQVQKLSDEGKYRDALQLLTRFYRSPDLTGPQRQRLVAWLDALAGKVIFSDEHHLKDMPYTMANESLVDVGNRWRVPAQLIYNINRKKISNPAMVAPGTSLKMVQGPFNAEVDTQQKVMTLFLGNLYAGRFPIRVGISGNPRPGDFQVLVKAPAGHDWRDSQGNTYPPASTQNGYGPNWIGLSGSLCIHEVADSVNDGHNGCLGLSSKDAKDVFGILSEGSTVKILR